MNKTQQPAADSSFPRRHLWMLGLAVLTIGASVASILWSRSATGTTSRARESGGSGTGTVKRLGVVCFGHVDLEHGVTALYPLQPGRVVEVLVREGQAVKAGDVLVRLEEGPARSRVAEAQAGLEAAELQLAQARKAPEQHRSRIAQQQEALEAMRRRLSAARHLHASKQKLAELKLLDAHELAITQDQVRELEALERVEEKRLADLTRQDPLDDQRRAEKEVAIAQARLDQARYALDDCQIKAPRPGSVLRLQVGPGDTLSGQPKQPAVLFAADGPLVVRAEVEQEFAGRVAAGEPVVVEDEASSGGTWQGKVERVANWFTQRRAVMQEPAEFNDVRTVECLVTLSPGQPPLRIGQRVRVLIGSVQ